MLKQSIIPLQRHEGTNISRPLGKKVMKKKRYFKGGIHNPLILRNAKFDYEVVEDGEVKTVEYEDCGEVYSYPEKTIVISSLSGGSDLGKNKFIVDLSTSDALKTLRKGEIISLKLSFSCNKDKDGKPVYLRRLL